MEIYIIIALIISMFFLLREYVHVLDQMEFYREKSVEYNGFLRRAIPTWDVDVDEDRPFIIHSHKVEDEEEEYDW